MFPQIRIADGLRTQVRQRLIATANETGTRPWFSIAELLESQRLIQFPITVSFTPLSRPEIALSLSPDCDKFIGT